MTTQTKMPRHVEFELDLRSLLEGLAERGRLCDDAVEQEADAALSLLRRFNQVRIGPQSPRGFRNASQLAQFVAAIKPISEDELPEDTDDALTPAE